MKNKYLVKLRDMLQNVGRELCASTALELHTSGVAYVTGCKKIVLYSSDKIELECGDCKMCFEGSKLNLKNLINGQISVQGAVRTVSFKND